MEAWHACAIQVETSVNPSAKQLHTIILEIDAPLGGTRTQSIRGCGAPRRTIAPLIGSHSTLRHIWNVSRKKIPQALAFIMSYEGAEPDKGTALMVHGHLVPLQFSTKAHAIKESAVTNWQYCFYYQTLPQRKWQVWPPANIWYLS